MQVYGKATRKIYRVGKSLVVVIPSEYARMHKLKPGDYLDMIYDRELIARPAKVEKIRECFKERRRIWT